MSLKCKYNECHFVHSSYKEIVRHVKSVHSIYFGFKIKCCHPACELEFKIMCCFETHVLSKHMDTPLNEIRLKCNVINCNEQLLNIDSLYSHYYQHLKSDKREKMVCFYNDCETEANEYRNFTKHLSKRHLDEKRDIILSGDVALIRLIKAEFFNTDEYQEKINHINENQLNHNQVSR